MSLYRAVLFVLFFAPFESFPLIIRIFGSVFHISSYINCLSVLPKMSFLLALNSFLLHFYSTLNFTFILFQSHAWFLAIELSFDPVQYCFRLHLLAIPIDYLLD